MSSYAQVSVSVDSFGGFDFHVSVYQGTRNGQLACAPGYSWRIVKFDAEPNSFTRPLALDGSSRRFSLRIISTLDATLCSDCIAVATIPNSGLNLTGSTENGRKYNGSPFVMAPIQQIIIR
jgi:hypothetical protein